MEHHISKIHWGNKDPQKNNLWYLEIYPIATGTQGYEDWGKSAIDQQTIDFLSTEDDGVSYYVRSAKIPNLSIGNHESKFMGLKIQLPSPEDTSEKRLGGHGVSLLSEDKDGAFSSVDNLIGQELQEI